MFCKSAWRSAARLLMMGSDWRASKLMGTSDVTGREGWIRDCAPGEIKLFLPPACVKASTWAHELLSFSCWTSLICCWSSVTLTERVLMAPAMTSSFCSSVCFRAPCCSGDGRGWDREPVNAVRNKLSYQNVLTCHNSFRHYTSPVHLAGLGGPHCRTGTSCRGWMGCTTRGALPDHWLPDCI